MARYADQWCMNVKILLLSLLCTQAILEVTAKRSQDSLTACQHLRRAESRRSKALLTSGTRIRIPRCTKLGEFEPVQCQNESTGTECWCVDQYGVEVPGTRNETRRGVSCAEPENCTESSCRMFCASGFDRDARSGCSICKCRNPCDGIQCPRGQICQQQEVKCKNEPCPPIPTCKKARSLNNWCPAGLPLSIEDSVRPFLCGTDPGKPNCPPLYQCLVESGNDYGVCCPSSLQYKKPGVCPNVDDTLYLPQGGYMCGTPCSHDLECRNNEKCCFTKGCQMNCQQPFNITTCHQARALSEILAVSEREGRGYIPDCSGPGGLFSSKQCSRNGLVCWCVDPKSGHKVKGTMGVANMVNCDGIENSISRSLGRSFNMDQCDTNLCAAVCEYGFKNDHNGCPTCECAEPCEGFMCPLGSHCEIATDPLCSSGSALCSSWPICKPDIAYSNPCDVGTPLTDNVTGEIFYCFDEQRESRSFQPISFFDEDPKEGRAMSNQISCPSNYRCTKLHKESKKVCCPEPKFEEHIETRQNKQQSMCEYLRDFQERMEGTEEGMKLAIPSPQCSLDGSYESRQCSTKKIAVTRNEQRQILEENTVRQMKMLLLNVRGKRETSNLKLYRVDEGALNIRVAAPVMGRSAKVIDTRPSANQELTELFETNVKKTASASKTADNEDELVEIDVEECWCVDGFGTEIPESRGFNVTTEDCNRLKETIECLDITCRMGCDYGFNLDPETKCPACNCRDPCDGVTCGDGKECRTVDVSCEGEYCPPVPACLPRKAGQCPFLVPPGSENSDTNICDYECRTDAHCDENKRCCSNGCGTQCVEPQLKTACQHLQTIQMHQASELGVPARKMYITQCDEITGRWKEIQCGPDDICWCLDDHGEEVSGTRTRNKTPICKVNSELKCPQLKCSPCESGYKVDNSGCKTCECRNLCDEISCLGDEECQLITVECIDSPCPKMPICVPKRDTVCPEGNPLKQGGMEVICGPQNENEACPTTHTCQLNPVMHRGVCCAKTRDVCFESLDTSCLAKSTNLVNTTKWRFSPKRNKCAPVVVGADETSACQSKNLFHSETACNSVCPVLTQCERLKLKNSLAAKRTAQPTVWFQPRCDPITGHWSPVQCLGNQPPSNNKNMEVSRGFSQSNIENKNQYGLCWCADKKGAPLKGSLTHDLEPTCNHRQARGRMRTDNGVDNPLMEELIRQMTVLVDIDDNSVDEGLFNTESFQQLEQTDVTERILEISNTLVNSKPNQSTKKLLKTATRCRALSQTASFPVACDENGAFLPTQCNGEQCWCVDAAGNQLPLSDTFKKETKKCAYTPIESVSIELHLRRESRRTLSNLYDLLKIELNHLLGNSVENLRVQESLDGNIIVRFDLHDDSKIDTAFAMEEMVKQSNFLLGNGSLRPDITLSRFVHRSIQIPVAEATSSTENTLQTVVFVLATGSAFLISIFVVFIMLKRGGKKKVITAYNENKIIGNDDKYIDYGSPIFVLSADENAVIKKSELESTKTSKKKFGN